MRKLMNHILAIADERKIAITNLHLQKLLYFVMLEAIRRKNISIEELRKLYDEPFLVWRYGPVIESIYDEYSVYGSTPIPERGEKIEEFDFLNEYIEQNLKKSPFILVERSHQHTHWKKHEDEIVFGRSNVPYSFENLEEAM